MDLVIIFFISKKVLVGLLNNSHFTHCHFLFLWVFLSLSCISLKIATMNILYITLSSSI